MTTYSVKRIQGQEPFYYVVTNGSHEYGQYLVTEKKQADRDAIRANQPKD
jgi:hypothetical protein